MFKLTFALKQHTPLIHFQHDQDGATLRATEVKPKLDRFIIEHLKDVENSIYEKYKKFIDQLFKPSVQGKSNSLYKIHINSSVEQKVLLFSLTSQADANLIAKHQNAIAICGENPEVYWKTPLFCNNSLIKFEGSNNQGNRRIGSPSHWDKLKVGIWLKDINLSIVTHHKELLDLIKECLPYLFSVENFGLRQSKGFGSFSTENQNEKHIKAFIGNYAMCIYKKTDNSDWIKKIEFIREFWKLLKAGDSFGSYYKSDLMKYFCMLDGTRWEKRKIKKSLHVNHNAIYNTLRVLHTPNRIAGCENDLSSPDEVNLNQNFKYIRALLGLAEHYEFGINGGSPLKVKISNPNIERFKSPITIKIFKDSIYLICFPIDSQLSNDESNLFSFEIDATPQNLANLPIPKEFSLCHFLDSPWLGKNFENVSNWNNYNLTGQTSKETIAKHFNFLKINL